jgi:PAS domain S-box-containing protein
MSRSKLEEHYAELIRELDAHEDELVNFEIHNHFAGIKRRVEFFCKMLRARLHLLETVLENSAESIYAKDKDGRYTYVNRKCEIEFKLPGEQTIGKTDVELFPSANADEYRSNDLVAMNKGKMWEHEVWWDDKIYLTRKLPLTSRSGKVEGICGISTDITNHRRTELALREAIMTLERERANKLMSVEAIMASIAHEVRQPLTAIATNGSAALRWFEKTPPDYDEVRAALNRAINDSRRVSEVFDSIRALFRKADQAREQIDLCEITLEVLQSLRGELKDHGVTAHTELASGLPLIPGHRSQLQQVFVNLVHNAIEAMDTTTDRSRMLRVRTELHDRDAIIVAVEDTGPGIDPQQLNTIFDAFVTTKTNGMGLGLAICRRIIESHGGELSAFSDGRSGALFQFVLPIQLRDSDANGTTSGFMHANPYPRDDECSPAGSRLLHRASG